MMTRQIMGMLPYVFCRISADVHLGLATQQQKKKKKKREGSSVSRALCAEEEQQFVAGPSIVSAVTKFRAGDWLNSHITDEKKI